MWLTGQVLAWPVQGIWAGIQHFRNAKSFGPVYWHTSEMLELRRLRQEDCEHVLQQPMLHGETLTRIKEKWGGAGSKREKH